MKVLVYMQNLMTGGAERTMLNIVEELSKKHKVTFVLGSEKTNSYDDKLDELGIEKILLNTIKTRKSMFKLSRIIRNENPDILFTTTQSNNIALIFAKLLSFRKIPVIVRVTNNTENQRVSWIKRLFVRFVYNSFASKVIALSDGVKKDLIKNFRIKKHKIARIYNPINLREIKILSNEPVDENEQHYFDKKRLKILNIGRLVEAKNQMLIVDIASELKKYTDNFQINIIGEGPLREELQEYINNKKMGNFINLMGYKKNPYKYLLLSDMFILTSKWEGFGHVIVEAMATNNLVLSVDCKSGPREILQDKYGVLIDYDPKNIAKTIYNLHFESEVVNKYKKLSMERANYYNAPKIVAEYEELFYSEIKR